MTSQCEGARFLLLGSLTLAFSARSTSSSSTSLSSSSESPISFSATWTPQHERSSSELPGFGTLQRGMLSIQAGVEQCNLLRPLSTACAAVCQGVVAAWHYTRPLTVSHSEDRT